MKKLVLAVAAVMALAAPAAFAASDHGKHGGHGSSAHEEVVDGVKAVFTVQTMKEAMKAMGMELPKGVKETHHIQVGFTDLKSGKALTEGEVAIKVLAPDKTEQTKNLSAMQGHFGGDFVMAKKGRYGVMSKFRLKDGTVRQARFWYQVK
ncbi:hypothetical protein [Trichlorobacter ammonificans]|uniref:YtkA-like domain-containing protein n=1 Tax=Trichlorobacter ammonificans TaxID=2916410 RepID=A0ABN8HH09_9BACT|nr:hypothetical protein [Trichlorobacter ammonificans]CAH2030403.1 conserved exported protein of unknown function [Trichlorobacter ammonificans]